MRSTFVRTITTWFSSKAAYNFLAGLRLKYSRRLPQHKQRQQCQADQEQQHCARFWGLNYEFLDLASQRHWAYVGNNCEAVGLNARVI